MVKKLQYGDTELRVNTNMIWMRKYKSQFGEDPVKLIASAMVSSSNDSDEIEGSKLMESLGFIGMQNIAWAVCSNGEDPDEWIEKIGDDVSVIDILSDVVVLVLESSASSKNSPTPAPVPKK